MPFYPPTANITTGGTIQAADVLTLYAAINGGLDSVNIAVGGLTGANIAPNSINIPLLKNSLTAFGVQQAATKHFGGGYFALASGAYSFFPGLSTDAGAGTIGSIGGNILNDATSTDFDVANVGGIARVQANQTAQAIVWLAVLNHTNVGTNQAFITAYYLQTSPPYDLGDGEIPVFIFALVGADGHPRMTYVGEDPPWAASPRKRLNVATKLSDAVKDDATLESHLQSLDEHAQNWQVLKRMKRDFLQSSTSQRTSMLSDISAIESNILSEVENTQQEKNRNMPTIPHPFVGNDLGGGGIYADTAPLTPVLLDPMSKNASRLALLHDAGENVCSLLHSGHIKIDNTAMKRSGPTGVMVSDHKFKNSKR